MCHLAYGTTSTQENMMSSLRDAWGEAFHPPLALREKGRHMKRTVLLLTLAAMGTLLACGAAYAAAVSFAPARSYPVGDYPFAVSAGDLDGDGDTDLGAANFGEDTVSVLIRRSDGTFRAPQRYAVGADPADVTRADFDRDGDLDLAAANFHSDDVSVLRNSGDGTFAAQRKYAAGNARPSGIESGDLDGDGDQDLITANAGGESSPDSPTSGTVSVFLNRGDGTFREARNFAAGMADEPQALDRSDFDGDGDLDLVVALGTTSLGEGGGLAVLRGRGDGTFGAPRRYEGPGFAEDVLANDLDGDGDSDLAAADLDDEVVVYKNDGDGAFLPAGEYYAGGTPLGVTEADFDRDGDLDLATSNAATLSGDPENVAVLANAGGGIFGSPRTFGAGVTPVDLTRARMNGDRKPDLVVANAGSDNVSVLLNTTQP